MATTRARSPNYPTLSLEEAVTAVNAIHEKEKRGTIPWSIAAKAMGYQALSGPVRSRIAALRQYGLIDVQSQEHLRISDRGYDLIRSPKNSYEYTDALRTAALEPPIFKELAIRMLDASDEAIAWWLEREKKFSPEGARRVLRAFRATMAFAKLDDERYDDDAVQDKEDGTVQQKGARRDAPPPPRGTMQYSWALSPSMSAELTLRGSETVSKKALDILKKQIELLIDALTDEEQSPGSQQPTGAPPTTEAPRGSSITAEAQELLNRVDDGGVPAFPTGNLKRIAEENGVSVSSAMTPNEIIEQIRQQAE